MKKNAMLKIAAVLLVAVLLTTCAISSTFAKYVADTATTSDSARVAKWGITVTNTVTTSGFKKAYVLGTNDTVVSAGAPVVAPGTSGKAEIQSVISGVNNTEVDVVVQHTWTVEKGSAFDDYDYDPMKFVVSTDDKALADVNWDSAVGFEGLKGKLAGALSENLTTIDAAAIADVTEVVYIYWKWDFETTGNNDKDTALGKAAAKPGDTTTNFTITLTTTAVQGGENYAK